MLGAADDEIVGGIAPILLQPRNIRLEATRCNDKRLCLNLTPPAITTGREKSAITHFQLADLRFVGDLHSESGSGFVIRIHHRLAATQHEEIAFSQMQSPAERLLPADAVRGHPVSEVFGGLNRQAGEKLVRLPSRYLTQILPKLLLTVTAGDVIRGRLVHVADIPRVAAVAAAEVLRGAFEHEHSRAGASRGNRGAKPGVATTNDEHVERLSQACH